MVDSNYPNYDWMVFLNKPSCRSIPDILHYHILLKSATSLQNDQSLVSHKIPYPFPLSLNKLVIINRHANRYPILKFPDMERRLNSTNLNPNFDADLTDTGKMNSKIFGTDMAKIYKLDDDFIENNLLLSSPVNRCIETLSNIGEGLGIIATPICCDDLLYDAMWNHESKESFSQSPGMILLYERYSGLLDRLQHIFKGKGWGTGCNRIMNLYDYYCSIVSYNEMGFDMKAIINESDFMQLKSNVTSLYNSYGELLAEYCNHYFRKILDWINKPYNLIICTTHDTNVFLIAKHLQKLFDDKNQLNLPYYLSNVRIEYWSDGIIRAYYDNYYLGNLSEKIEKKILYFS
jgi:hypothetical protein